VQAASFEAKRKKTDNYKNQKETEKLTERFWFSKLNKSSWSVAVQERPVTATAKVLQ